MNANTPDIYKIGVPQAWRGELEDAIREAALETGVSDMYSVSEVDPQEASSEMNFDPVIPLLVLKFVLQSAAAFLVGMAVERVIRKMSPRNAAGARIIIMFPDGEIETINTSDAAATNAAVKRLKEGVV